MSDLDNVREILRTLAEVRDGPFYSLYVGLTHHSVRPMPQIDFRIYKVADSAETSLHIWVSTTRTDWAEVSWGVSLTTTPKSFVVAASVEISDGDEIHEVFARLANTQDCSEASKFLRQFANEVCAELGPLEDKADKED
jgi:hypothetical protein